MTWPDVVDTLREVLSMNLSRLLFSFVAIMVGYAVYRVVAREIRSMTEQKRLEQHVAYTLTRITQWVAIVAVLSAILAQFGVTIAMVSGLFTLIGGTIIGFAAINTLGNAIAGLIVMTSRPFRVGDRIFFNGQFADVEAIELIYTKMLTLDNVLVSIPNQELLKAQIDNYGRDSVVRRKVAVTPGFEYASQDVVGALLEAAAKVPSVLKEPKPYVRITDFQPFAVEYTLYTFINDIKELRAIDAELHREVLATCKEHNIDISTPQLLRQIEE
jgi:small conductance mechanosensitive channel